MTYDNSYKNSRGFNVNNMLNSPIMVIDKEMNTNPRKYIIIQNQSEVDVHLVFEKPVDFSLSLGLTEGTVWLSKEGGSLKLPPGAVYEEFPEQVHKGAIYAATRTEHQSQDAENLPFLMVFENSVDKIE